MSNHNLTTNSNQSENRPVVVGVGASAGGLEAIVQLLACAQPDLGVSYVIIQHLSPDHHSALAEILAKRVRLPIYQVTDSTEVHPNHVYVIPPGKYLSIKENRLELSDPQDARGARMAVDFFMRSLAEDASEFGIGVLLSGTGSDGSVGLKEIKHYGGLTVVQDPDEAAHRGMPQAAIQSGSVDLVMPVTEIAPRLEKYISHARQHGTLSAQAIASMESVDLAPVLSLLRREASHDFRNYRKATLTRRVSRRMGLLGLEQVSDYVTLLEDNVEEISSLKKDLLIGVTRFFREPDSWEMLESKVLKKLVQKSTPDQPIRIWCAGCATGEEAYTLAMLMLEQIALIDRPVQFQIFASDVSEDALETAREGKYSDAIVADIPVERLRRFFQKIDGGFRVSKELREKIVFTEQNLLAQAPFSKLDLITCRNLLIYLKREAQQNILSVFQFALKQEGVLFLGSSESVEGSGDLFKTVHAKHRIYRRTAQKVFPPNRSEDSPSLLANEFKPVRNVAGQSSSRIGHHVYRQLIKEFEEGVAVVNQSNQVLYLEGRADLYLQLELGEISTAPPDIFSIAREGIRPRLRTLIRKARQSSGPIEENCRVKRDEQSFPCSIRIRKLVADIGEDRPLLITFSPSQSPRSVELDKDENDSAAGSTEDELRHELLTTREQLNTTIVQLETANEELKATNEEALTMNEQLQSGNEELETSKEELQSLNEELTTLNHQLELKLTELQHTTDDLNNLLSSASVPTIFLDTNLRIRRFTPSCEQLYNFIPTDVGRPLADIVRKHDDDSLMEDAKKVLQDLIPADKEIACNGDQCFIRRIHPYRTEDDRIQGVVLTFADVTELTKTREDAAKSLTLLDNIYRLAPIGLGFHKRDLTFVRINDRLAEINGFPAEEHIGKHLREILPEELADDVVEIYEQVIETGEPVINVEITGRTSANDSDHTWQVSYMPVKDDDDYVIGVSTVVQDVTEQRHYERQLAESRTRLELALQAGNMGVWSWEIEDDSAHWSPQMFEIFGVNPDEFRPRRRSFLNRVHPEDKKQAKKDLEEPLNSGSSSYHSVCRIIRDDDRSVGWVENRAVILRDEANEPIRLTGVTLDITERVERENSLRQANVRLELSMAHGNLAEWSWDAEKNEVIPNPSLNKMFGFEETSTPSTEKFIERIDESARDRVATAIESAIQSGGIYDEEYPIILPNGETRHVRARGRAQLTEDGKLLDFFGVVADITERKIREMELEDREAHLRRVINNQLGLVGVIGRDGILLEVDDRSLEFAETSREEVIGKHFADAPWWNYDPAVADKMRDSMQRAMSGEIIRYDVSLFAHGEEGVMIDFMMSPIYDDDGNVEYLIPSGVDIRDRIKSEQENRENAQRLKMAMQAGGMAAWEWSPEGSYWTNEVFDLLGIPPEETANPELFFSLVHPDDIDELKSNWEQATQGKDNYNCQFRITRPDGEIRWINGLGEVVKDEDGKVIRMYGLNWDSTVERKREEQLKESERNAQLASAAKSEFLANMSHEIRTPMTAILGYAELLEEQVISNDAQRYLTTIRRNGDYLLDIINDILDLSKIEAGKLEIETEPFNPVNVVEDVQSIMSVRAKESQLSLDVNYDLPLPKKIHSDKKRLKQILINLVGNAIKFTQEGQVNIHVSYSDHQMKFKIIDTGIGMPENQVERLFQPFTQGDASVTRNFGGTGLGLAISQRLAMMLGGQISATSTENVGSEFTLTISTGDQSDIELVEEVSSDDSIDFADAEELSSRPLDLTDHHILVVDDRRDIRFLSRHILSKAGAEVSEAEDGLIAVQILKRTLSDNAAPDLILLDMQMPNLDGYKTAKQIRALGYDGPIIALTADAMQGDMSKCLECGCNDYLPKPIDKTALIQMVHRMINENKT